MENTVHVFTRSKDFHRYVNLIENIALSMASTISKISGYDISEVMREYTRIARGPSALDEILIERGEYTIEEFNENCIEAALADMVCAEDTVGDAGED